MAAYQLKSCALVELVALLIAEKAESIRFESGTEPVLTIHGGQFPVQGPALSDSHAEDILRCAGNSREIREFREAGKVELLHEAGDYRFLIRATNAFQVVRVEVHLLRS